MWIAAGQGRVAADGDGPEMPEADEYTFSEDSPVDWEGYAVSEEERAETRPRTGASAKGRSARRDQR
jgi:hypothetical protein